jgi:cob(I)alamin adenosyltransferase
MRSRVTSKNGDKGQTRTLGGEVVSKSHLIVEASGDLDTLRAQLALLRLQILQSSSEEALEHAEFLFWLLHVCFLMGTQINDPQRKKPEYWQGEIGQKHLETLENGQERIETTLNLPRAFLVSASTIPAAHADLAATAARQLERSVVRLSEAIPDFDATWLLPFLNRLSDYLWVLGRALEGGKHLPVDYSRLER